MPHLHDLPHVTFLFKSFDASPSNVVNDPATYAQTLGFLATAAFIMYLILLIIFSIISCRCRDTEKDPVPNETAYRCRLWTTLILTMALAGCVGYSVKENSNFATDIDKISGALRELDGYQSDLIQLAVEPSRLAGTSSNLLTQLLSLGVLPSNLSIPLRAGQSALVDTLNFASKVNSSATSASLSSLSDPLSSANDIRTSIIYGMAGFVIVAMILAVWHATLYDSIGPLSRLITGLSVIVMVASAILACAHLSLATAVSDTCVNPPGYLREVSHRAFPSSSSSSSDAQAAFNFAISCMVAASPTPPPPSSPHPLTPTLNKATVALTNGLIPAAMNTTTWASSVSNPSVTRLAQSLTTELDRLLASLSSASSGLQRCDRVWINSHVVWDAMCGEGAAVAWIDSAAQSSRGGVGISSREKENGAVRALSWIAASFGMAAVWWLFARLWFAPYLVPSPTLAEGYKALSSDPGQQITLLSSEGVATQRDSPILSAMRLGGSRSNPLGVSPVERGSPILTPPYQTASSSVPLSMGGQQQRGIGQGMEATSPLLGPDSVSPAGGRSAGYYPPGNARIPPAPLSSSSSSSSSAAPTATGGGRSSQQFYYLTRPVASQMPEDEVEIID